MARRRYSDCTVYVGWDDATSSYRGTVVTPDGAWPFDNLKLGGAFSHLAVDSPEAFTRAAESALSFGSYYSTHNRGSDLPEWAPSAELADAMQLAAVEATEVIEWIAKQRRNGARITWTSQWKPEMEQR